MHMHMCVRSVDKSGWVSVPACQEQEMPPMPPGPGVVCTVAQPQLDENGCKRCPNCGEGRVVCTVATAGENASAPAATGSAPTSVPPPTSTYTVEIYLKTGDANGPFPCAEDGTGEGSASGRSCCGYTFGGAV